MTNTKTKKDNKVRNLTLTVCALTLGIPIAAAAFPATYAFIVPLAVILPFFTLTYLESALCGAEEVKPKQFTVERADRVAIRYFGNCSDRAKA